jgi:tetratricopeptide (TPR) repeat protein
MESLSFLVRSLDSLRTPAFSLIQSVLKALRKSKVRFCFCFVSFFLFFPHCSSQLRRPDLVVKYGPKFISGASLSDVECNLFLVSLSNDLPTVFGYYENIFTAALDHGDYDTADKYLRILVNRFPQSSRVKRLLGMAQEAQGDYSGALKIYDEILAETPTNLLVLKRKVLDIHSSSLHSSLYRLQFIVLKEI